MHRSKPSIVSRVAIVAAFVSVCQGATAADAPMSKEVKNLVDFQCHAVKTSKQAEANQANMARAYTDRHPVMECLKTKIEELKAAGK
jgi:outer membrane lipoprotein-sorting protein